MHPRLHASWRQVLAGRGDSVALVDAELGRTWTFGQLECLADDWLATNDSWQDADGQVWCLALSDRVAWLSVFLAAIKVGAVLLPLESGDTSVLRAQARQQAAAVLIDNLGVHSLEGGVTREGNLLIKLTSGTTGAPKALPFTESEMMADGWQIMCSMSISGRDRNFAVLPLGHSYGLGNLVMPFFMDGVAMVLGSSPYPQVIVEELTQFPCTLLPLVTPIVKGLSAVSLEGSSMAGLRLVISAGSYLSPEIAQRFHANTGLKVHNFYGSSETGAICFDRSAMISTAEGAVGTAMEGVELLVGENQSIQVRSHAICHALYPDGICPLHDFGKIDESGVLRLTGRHQDIIKIAGRRVSLSEIESVLCSLDQVTDAYVSSRPSRTGETRCVALYCGEVLAEEVKATLQSKLPEWKVPKRLHKVEAIPYNARGKKDRAALEQILDSVTGRS